jgi:DNA-binding GntR family transcriptional regulator
VVSKKKTRNGDHLNGKKSLTLSAYQRIKEMMLNYEIIPGQRLVFVDLAKKIGVSRTPVNNALSILANEGYVDFIPHQGYAVHKLTPREAGHLYQIRGMIEQEAVELAIRQLTSKRLEKLDTLRRKKEIISEKLHSDHVTRKNFILDLEFHLSYIEMAGNPYLTNFFREIYQRIFLRHRLEGLSIARNKQVDFEHDEIFKAISSKDIRKAKESIKRHIKAAEESLFSIFD